MNINLSPDQEPWVEVARRILAGEFRKADNSTIKSLKIGLAGIHHPVCQEALAKLHITST